MTLGLYSVKTVCQMAFSGVPRVVQVETQTPCNRSCRYCPVSTERRSFAQLPLRHFEGLCLQLACAGFKGMIQLQGFNEPLLDDRITDFIGMARRILPESWLTLNTNGDLLNHEGEVRLAQAGLNHLFVTRHDEPDMLPIRRQVGAMLYSADPIAREVGNRCGFVRDDSIDWRRHGLCFMAYPIVLADGRIAFCCMDWDARNGGGATITDPDWLDKWGALPARLTRLRTVLGPRPVQCARCKFGLTYLG